MIKKEGTRELSVFLLITLVMTSGIFIWMFHGGSENMLAVILMMWTPGISALLTLLICKKKLTSLGWRPGKLRFLAYAYLLPLLFSLVAYGLAWLTGLAGFSAEGPTTYRWAAMLGFTLPVPAIVGVLSKMFLGFLFTLVFVTGEEIGWSGFLTPQLLQHTSVPVTSLAVGLFWALWHYPAIIGGFYGQGTPLWVALPGFTMVMIALSFVRTVLVKRSGSLWTGAVLHASSNTILMGIFWELTVQKGKAAYFVSETGVVVGAVSLLLSIAFWKMMDRQTKENAGYQPVRKQVNTME